MLQTSSNQLPEEIIYEILDYFRPEEGLERGWEIHWNGNLATLKACLMVCRLFRHYCYRYFFSVLQIHAISNDTSAPLNNRQQKLIALSHLSLAKPDIANYVEHLDLTVTRNDREWITEERTFTNIMKWLKSHRTQLKKLSITGEAVGGGERLPICDPSELEQDFINPFIRSASVTCLRLTSLYDLPISLFTSCPNLSYLGLDDTSTESAVNNKYVNEISPKIRTLDFNSSTTTIKHLVDGRIKPSPVNFSHLQVLRTNSLDGSFTNFLGLRYLRHACAESLEEFYFHSDDRIHSTSARWLAVDIDLASFSNLRVLHLHLGFWSRVPVPTDPLANLAEILQQLPSTSSLATLSIRFCIGYDAAVLPESCFSAQWEKLDNQVLSMAGGQSFEFTLQLDYIHYPWYVEFDEDSNTEKTNPYDQLELESIRHETLQGMLRQRFAQVNSSPWIRFTLKHTFQVYL